MELFGRARLERQHELDTVVDRIAEKFGRHAVRRAASMRDRP
jgi:hypothetical protein